MMQYCYTLLRMLLQVNYLLVKCVGVCMYAKTTNLLELSLFLFFSYSESDWTLVFIQMYVSSFVQEHCSPVCRHEKLLLVSQPLIPSLCPPLHLLQYIIV